MRFKPQTPINLATAWSLYVSTGSVHRAAKALGTCGESLRKKLNSGGYRLFGSKWTEEEDRQIALYYRDTEPSEFSIQRLADLLKRSFASVALRASRAGLTAKRTDGKTFSSSHLKNLTAAHQERGRNLTDEQRSVMASRTSARWKKQGHPRGMLGKHHSQATKASLSKAQAGIPAPPERTARSIATRMDRYGTLAPRVSRGNWKSEWVTVGSVKFFARSQWESNYARYLEWLRSRGEVLEWSHEPDHFKFPNNTSYLPDFKVTTWTGEVEYHEVKGWMDKRSVENSQKMKALYPKVKVLLVNSARYKALSKHCAGIVPGWIVSRAS